MGQLIIIRGPPGIGKSAVAKGLAKELAGNVALIEVDKLRWNFIANRVENFDDRKLVHKILATLIENFLAFGLDVIVEGILSGRNEDGKLRVDNYTDGAIGSEKVHKFFLKSDEKNQWDRITNRENSESKQFSNDIDKNKIKDWSKLAYGAISEHDTVIDTSNMIKQEVIELILKKVKSTD